MFKINQLKTATEQVVQKTSPTQTSSQEACQQEHLEEGLELNMPPDEKKNSQGKNLKWLGKGGKKKEAKITKDDICPTCRAAFVGIRNVITAGAPLKSPLALASNSKEWDRIPPLYYGN